MNNRINGTNGHATLPTTPPPASAPAGTLPPEAQALLVTLSALLAGGQPVRVSVWGGDFHAEMRFGEANPERGQVLKQRCWRASPDFRSLLWGSEHFGFSALQSHAIRALVLAWQSGCPEVGTATLLEASGTSGESVKDIFKSRPDIWGTLVIQGTTRGSYRLRDPHA